MPQPRSLSAPLPILPRPDVGTLELAGGVFVTAAGAACLAEVSVHSHILTLLSSVVFLVLAGVVELTRPRVGPGLGWANRITMLRGCVIAILVGMMPCAVSGEHALQWWPVGLAVVALLLDGADGWVARYTRGASAFGARLDMELDALLVFVLAVFACAHADVGVWVVLLGMPRYGFLAAMRVWPWLAGPLPENTARKAVCVWQVAALTLIVIPVVGDRLAFGVAFVTLLLLAQSFGRDIYWLWRCEAAGRLRRGRPCNHGEN